MHAEFDFVLMPVRQDVYMFLSVSVRSCSKLYSKSVS